ncbi:hypothetical protein BpHYR1_040130, partial [Brachionus plicatilis]
VQNLNFFMLQWNLIWKFSQWMRRDIKSGLRRKFSAWEAFKKSGWNAQKKIVYNRAKKEAEKLVKEGVKSYEESIAGSAKSNPKEFYRYVNNKSGNGFREVIKALKNSDGVVSNDPKEIADFKEYKNIKSERRYFLEKTDYEKTTLGAN